MQATPKICIVAIGNEILNGRIVNTNAAFIGKLLWQHGYSVNSQLVLPDEKQTLLSQLRYAKETNDIVITTGGLGPTCDDVTRGVIAAIWDCELALNKDVKSYLAKRFKDVHIAIDNQATIPTKAKVMRNLLGTAPGLYLTEQNKAMFVLPGVPRECEVLVTEQLLPILKKEYPQQHSLYQREVGIFAISESRLSPTIDEIQANHPTIQVGIYPNLGMVKVVFTILSNEPKEAQSTLDVAIEPLLNSFADNIYTTCGKSLLACFAELCRQKGISIYCYEGHTRGNISKQLSLCEDICFIGGIVSTDVFTKDSWQQILNSESSKADLFIATPYLEQQDSLDFFIGFRDNYHQHSIMQYNDTLMQEKRSWHAILATIYQLVKI